jgi:hypothetical protein
MKKIPLMIIVLILALGAAAGLAWAGSSPNYAIDRQVLAAGGEPAVSNSSDLSLNGTLGQPITGSSTSGNVVLLAGYWSKAPRPYVFYLPLIGK